MQRQKNPCLVAALPPGNVLHIPDDLETFWMIWKLSGWFGNFPDDKFFQKRIYVNVAKTIDPLF